LVGSYVVLPLAQQHDVNWNSMYKQKRNLKGFNNIFCIAIFNKSLYQVSLYSSLSKDADKVRKQPEREWATIF